MSRTAYNILSNAVARIWAMGIGIVLLPVYTHLIGMEAYGLVGFYASMSTALGILDLGLASTLSRELARAEAIQMSPERIRNLTYSFECIYWGVGITLGLLVLLLAQPIAYHWVKADKIPLPDVQQAVMLMGGILAFQWPQSLYTGALIGLQKQVTFNAAHVLLSTLRSGGVVLALWWIAPTIGVFFTWQIVVAALTVLAFRFILWHYLPKSNTAVRFSNTEVRRVWKFAAGMTGISLATFCLMQLDKIVLSKMLPLRDYGYYTFAWAIGTALLFGIGVIGNALLPKMVEVVARGQHQASVDAFHQYNRFMISVVAPIGLFLALFSKEILAIWTQNPETTENVWLAVSILTLGTMFNGFMHLPYYFMLAQGETKFTIYQNIIASIILTPLLFWWTKRWGLTGATLVWFSVNLAYNIICLPLVHKWFIRDNVWKTYRQDMGLPVIISVCTLGLGRLLWPTHVPLSIPIQIFLLGFLLPIPYLLILWATPAYRLRIGWLLQQKKMANG